MPAYHFVAVNNDGREKKGVIEAETEKQARQLLRNKSLVPIALRQAQEKKSTDKKNRFALFARKQGLASKDLALITRQFATLLAAGLPVR